MTHKLFIFFLMLMSVCTSVHAGGELIMYNANVVDTDKGTVLYGRDITVEDGVIVSVRPSRGRLRRGALDMTGKFVVPGLIDSHVHFANACRTPQAAQKLAGEYLANGVTTCRDVGGNYLFLKEYDRLRGEGRFDGPDVYYSSIWAAEPFDMPSVHAEGAESENNPWSRMFSIRDSSDVALEKAVREAYETGCTGFKLYINYSAEDIARIVEMAGKYGMKVWGHSSQIYGADAMQVASSGIEVMSHAYLLPRHYYPGRHLSPSDREYVGAVLDEMLRNDVVLDMTVFLSYGSGTFFASEVARMAYEKGVSFVTGTDLPGCRLHDEIDMLSEECGIAAVDILRAATVTGARIIGKTGVLGVIAEGAEADMIVLDANPLGDLSVLRDICLTVSDGDIVYSRPSAGGSVTLYNCNVVDTEAGKILRGRTIEVRDGIITDISRAAASPGEGDVDMTGRYVMPGMIDSHVHWGIFSQNEELSETFSKDFLAAGVTTVRDLGSNWLNISRFNKGVRNGLYAGPRVFYSALWAAGNYFMDPMDSIGWEGTGDPPWSRKLNVSECTDEEIEKAVLEARAIGCTGFKLYINYSGQDLDRIVPVMKRHGMKVWSHASQVKGADALVVARSGVDAVSHAYMLCNDLTSRDSLTAAEKDYLKRVFRELRRNKVILDATAHISMYEGEMMYSREIISLAYKAGVKIAAGTDFFGCAIYDEILQLSRCGISNADILRAVTCHGAEILGMEEKLGTIREGAVADLLVLDSDPFEQISALADVRMTYVGGLPVYVKDTVASKNPAQSLHF